MFATKSSELVPSKSGGESNLRSSSLHLPDAQASIDTDHDVPCLNADDALIDASDDAVGVGAYGDDDLGFAAAIQNWPVPIPTRFQRLCKRTIDIVGSIALGLVLSPFLLLAALLIKLSSPGPVLFRQVRVGRSGERFLLYKFRSMYVDAEQRLAEVINHNEFADDVKFKSKSDPRVTWIGYILRRTSFDEIPQLWNVLQGEMTLVGPRPPIPDEVRQYNPTQLRRLAVKPGLTCLWQVSGRSNLSFHDQVSLDLEYIQEQGFWTDVKIMVRTIPAVVLMRGAY